MITSRRVLHLIDLLDEYRAGEALRDLIPRLDAAGRRSEVVALRCTAPGRDKLQAAGIGVHVLSRRWSVDPILLGRLRQLLRAERRRLLHCWDLASLAYAITATVGGRLPPVVLSVDARQPRTYLAGRLLAAVGSRATRVLASNAATAEWCVACGIPQGSITLSPQRVAIVTRVENTTGQFAARLNLPPEARSIAVAGSLKRENCVEEAIWRYELVRVLHPSARLLVFGDGPDRFRLERFARLVSDEQGVRFLGYRDDVRQLLPHCHVYWNCRETDDVPRSLLEAMSANVPVIASDTRSAREVIVPGENGFLAPLDGRAEFARYTVRLFEDAQLAERMGAAAARTVGQRFTIEQSTREVVDAYLSCEVDAQAE